LPSLRESLDAAPHAVLENQRQLAVVAGLCNAASFEGSPSDPNRKINGDATGELTRSHSLLHLS